MLHPLVLTVCVINSKYMNVFFFLFVRNGWVGRSTNGSDPGLATILCIFFFFFVFCMCKERNDQEAGNGEEGRKYAVFFFIVFGNSLSLLMKCVCAQEKRLFTTKDRGPFETFSVIVI